MQTTTKTTVNHTAHKVCQCGRAYNRREFNALPAAYVTLSGSLYSMATCTSCRRGISTVIKKASTEEAD